MKKFVVIQIFNHQVNSKRISVSTKRYSANSVPFGLVIRSVDKPVYVDDKINRKNIGTKIEVQLTEKIDNVEFNETLKSFFLFHPEGIKFENSLIPKTPKEALLESFKKGFKKKFKKSYLLGNDVFSISSDNAQLNYIIPSLDALEKWNSDDRNSCIITNGCVFVSSNSILWRDPIVPSMTLLNKGLFILSLKEGKYNISAKRNKIEIPHDIIEKLDKPLKETINNKYLETVKNYTGDKNFFYSKSWSNLKNVFDDEIIKSNSDYLTDFCLEITFEDQYPKLVKLEKINNLKGFNFLDSNSDIFDSIYYKIYKWLRPDIKFVLIKVASRDKLLRSLINHNIRNMQITDITKSIYSKNLIREVSGHPLTNYLTEYIAIAESNFFTENNIRGALFFTLQNHPSIEQIGMKRKKNRRNIKPCIFINEGHPWTKCMSKINSVKVDKEKQLKIEQIIYWVMRSRGEDQKPYLKDLSNIPVEIGLSENSIQI